MKIKSLQLKNGYKRFFDLKIDLGDNPKRIIALVGPNGCGKSSVFDGMLYHISPYIRYLGSKDVKENKYHSMDNNILKFDYQNINIEFTNGNFATVMSEKKKLGKEKTIFSLRSPYRYNSNLKVKESRATSDIRNNGYGASSLADIDDKMEENYRRIKIKYNKYLHQQDCKPSEAKAKIIGDLNNALKNCLDIEIYSIGDIEADQGTIYFKKNDQLTEFEFNVLSSGEKEVVDILLDLYLRQEEYNDTIFIIDEPELHINTAIQRKLFIEINKLIGKNCQIWIATHSIGFLRALQEDFKNECQIIQFESEKKWASEPFILKPIKKTISNWKNIFETALDDLTGLVSPKRLIYCEGKDCPKNGQEDGFDAKVYNNIFGEKYHDTLFISSGGNTELDQRSEIAIAILTKVFSNIEILVLKDRDMASGNKTGEKERVIYLENNPKNHRVLNRLEIENYIYDQEVLQKYCNKKKLEFAEDTYNKEVTDITNDNVKDKIEIVKRICNIQFSISNNNFKLNLSEFITEDMNVYKELESVIFKS